MDSDRPVKVIQGNEACALGAVAAGARFFAGYPITPSTEIAELLAQMLPAHGGTFIQMEDEIASMCAVLGASLAGVKAMTATSGPGFSLKQEAIGFGCIAEIPCVVVDVQRMGPSTGLPTAPGQGDLMQARWGTHGDHPVVALCPSSVTEVYTLTIRAFNIAEQLRTPVILLMDEVVGHMRERLDLDAAKSIPVFERKRYGPPRDEPDGFLPYHAGANGVPPMPAFGEGCRYHVTGLLHDESGFPTEEPDEVARLVLRLHSKIELHRDEITFTESHYLDDASVAVLAFGAPARSALQAVFEARERGVKAGLMKICTIWPFPDRELSELSQRVEAVIVPEMNMGQARLMVERACGQRTRVIGVNRYDGGLITSDQILNAILEAAGIAGPD